MSGVGQDIQALLAELQARVDRAAADGPDRGGCPVPGFALGEMAVNATYCDGQVHGIATSPWQMTALAGAAGRCPIGELRAIERAAATEIARIPAEARRFEGRVSDTARGLVEHAPSWQPAAEGVIPLGPPWRGRCLRWRDFVRPADSDAAAAFLAAQAFVSGLAPRRRLVLHGNHGNGKTLLALLVHFELLRRGRASYFVTPDQLRALLSARFGERSEREEAAEELSRMHQADALVLDDLGGVQADGRRVGLMQEGLKALLEDTSAALLVTTNLTLEAAARHPDMGSAVVSRLLLGATTVEMRGDDWRALTAKPAGGR